MTTKRLELVHPHNSQNEYVPGVNCDDIRPVSHGYAVIMKTVSVTFPHHRVSHYTEDHRQGMLPEPVTEEDVPEYAVKDGTKWQCRECERKFAAMHALKVHYGIMHGER